jgi:hypothetical protein
MESKRKAALELLETQKKRVEQLNARRQNIQITVGAARQQYDQAVKEATDEHKTADLDKLRAELVRLETENTNVLAEFVQAVDRYEALIVRIENALADPEAMSALLSSLEHSGAAMAAPAAESVAEAAVPAAVSFDDTDI